jgi:hypothetical protein
MGRSDIEETATLDNLLQWPAGGVEESSERSRFKLETRLKSITNMIIKSRGRIWTRIRIRQRDSDRPSDLPNI